MALRTTSESLSLDHFSAAIQVADRRILAHTDSQFQVFSVNMNFLDPYDVANPATATPPEQAQPQPSLEEEVNQVIGQLGGFWGMIRKQVCFDICAARQVG